MSSLTSRLALRLARYASLDDQDKLALEREALDVRRYAPGELLARHGASVERIFIIADGFACRYKHLSGDRRQITSLMLPGDLCDTHTFSLPRMDHSIGALSSVAAVLLTAGAVTRLESSPQLAKALACNSAVHNSIAREWQLSVGSRTALQRTGHLLCEVFERLRAVDLVYLQNMCEVSFTQSEIAEMLALSPVHVNRTLMDLRRADLLSLQNKQLIVHDYPALCRATGFNPAYLGFSTAADAVQPEARLEQGAPLRPG